MVERPTISDEGADFDTRLRNTNLPTLADARRTNPRQMAQTKDTAMTEETTSTETTTAPETGKVYTAAEYASAQAQMRAAREEAKGHRLAASEAKTARETAEAALAAASNTHTEKLTAADARFIRSEMKAAALSAGIVDATDALALIPMDKIERDADGNPTNAAELLAELKASKPYLFGAPGIAPRSTSSTAPAPKPGPVQTKMVKDMTPEEYKAARAAAIKR